MPRRASEPVPRSRSTHRGEGQDAIELLTEDHRKVDAMFEDYESQKEDADESQKQELVEHICFALTVHATIEEEIFYPAAREALRDDGADTLDEAEVEHASIRELVEQLRSMQPDEDLFDAKVKVLAEYVKHHVNEEEDEIFRSLREKDFDGETVGEDLARRKRELTEEMSEEFPA